MELYKVGVPDQLIFPVNCTSREPDDKAIAREFRKRVMEKCMGEKEKIPLPWFILEQLLQLLAQKMYVSVLNIDECCDAAQQKLLMPHNACEAALRYLGKLNIIFYRPDILPGVVFSSAQVILDKITELVRCNHALRTEGGRSDAVPSYINSGGGLRFREYGLLDAELLNRAFPSHYRQDLFASPDFLLLLERMLIAGKLNTGEHFIPSLLPDLPVENIAEYRATADHPPPLVIHYPKMWLPVGVMSSLVVYLQNQCQWVLAEESGKPICMFHNCIQFFLPRKKRGYLVLIDSVKFLEVHVRPENQMKPELLYKVKDNVMAGLKKAHESLHYDPPETDIGWLCSGKCENKEVHLAMLDDDRETWTCTKNHEVGSDLAPEHQIWFKDGRKAEESEREQRKQGTEEATLNSGECPVITRLRENLTFINTTVTAGGSPQHFANKLVEKAFLPHHIAQQILNALGSTPDQQASKLMESVFARIKPSNQKEKLFKDFIDIFSSEPAYEDLVKTLRGTDTTQQLP